MLLRSSCAFCENISSSLLIFSTRRPTPVLYTRIIQSEAAVCDDITHDSKPATSSAHSVRKTMILFHFSFSMDFSFSFGRYLLLRKFHAAFQQRLTTAFMGCANTFLPTSRKPDSARIRRLLAATPAWRGEGARRLFGHRSVLTFPVYAARQGSHRPPRWPAVRIRRSQQLPHTVQPMRASLKNA